MKGKKLSERNAKEVFEDHLKMAEKWGVEEDLTRNVSKDIVLLTNFGIFRGHEGVRKAAKLLGKEIPNGKFKYKVRLCHGNMCFLHWTGDSDKTYVDDGADSFFIEDGVIKIQTIYYTVKKKTGNN